MDIWDFDKLLLFIAFVVPGFVGLKTYEALVPRAEKASSQQLVDAVAYSSIHYAVLLWPIVEIERQGVRATHPTVYIAFYVFVLLIAPIAWAFLFRALRHTQLFQGALPHPTGRAWDYIFSKRKPYWIIVSLKDGTQIAGRYDSQSFASSAPAPEQLYLEERWVLNADGGFDRPRAETNGVLILASDIVSVEFFRLTRGGSNEQRETEHQTGARPEGGAASAIESASR